MKNTYVINGVTYIVDAKYEPVRRNETFSDRLKHYLKSDFADFTKKMKGDTLTSEYVLTAGKD